MSLSADAKNEECRSHRGLSSSWVNTFELSTLTRNLHRSCSSDVSVAYGVLAMQSRAMEHLELLKWKLVGFDRTSEASSSSKLLLAAMLLLLCLSQSLRVHILHDDLQATNSEGQVSSDPQSALKWQDVRSMATTGATLDHVIILLPYKDITNPPSWLTDHFTITPGGRHADNKTENKLILFRDGTYVELIAFINDDPARRKGHWWDKPFGIIDYALTDSDVPDFDTINKRLAKTDTGISYANPVAGGRSRPDGVELQWKVTFPQGIERGNVPFWCNDITPRERRVPISEDAMKHPCGALGMAAVQVEVDATHMTALDKALAAILDVSQNLDSCYDIRAPDQVDSLKKPCLRIQSAEKQDMENAAALYLTLVLQAPIQKPAPDIRHKIDNGTVSILFESSGAWT